MSATLRLNQYLASTGLGSRRQCEELIRRGRVTVDGKVVTDFACRVHPEQEVTIDGRPLQQQKHVYWLVNKPEGYLCTNYDPAGRPRVIDLLLHVPQRIYTVGRLDEDSEGLLLLTNDGDLAQKLMHPRYRVQKTYHVQVAGVPSKETMQKMREGIWLSAGKVHVKRVKKLKTKGESTYLEIVLTEGKNREIRRMMAKLGHKVYDLRRVAIGPIKLGRLKTGKYRKLTRKELNILKEMTERKASEPASRSKRSHKKKLKPLAKPRRKHRV